MKAIHPVTDKVEAVKVFDSRFKLRSVEFPNGEVFPADTVKIVCNVCEQKECVCQKAA